MSDVNRSLKVLEKETACQLEAAGHDIAGRTNLSDQRRRHPPLPHLSRKALFRLTEWGMAQPRLAAVVPHTHHKPLRERDKPVVSMHLRIWA